MTATAKVRKLVLLEWVDSVSIHGNAWTQMSVLEENLGPLPCRTVGWLLSDDKGVLIVAPHISGGDTRTEYGKGEIEIPKCAVIRIVALEEGEPCPL